MSCTRSTATTRRACSIAPQLQAHVRSDRYLGGILDPRSGHLHPLKYTQGLARAAEAAGVRIFENTQALGYEDGREIVVRTAQGSVALPASRAVRQRLSRLRRAGARAADSGRGHLHHRDAAARSGARPRVAAEQCGHRRHQLDLGLLPTVRR